jgi:hypothetical protein
VAVESHGGRIWVRSNSRDGRGSVFSIQLPLDPVPRTAPLSMSMRRTGDHPVVPS